MSSFSRLMSSVFSFGVLFDVENVSGLASDLDDVLFFSKFITSFVEALESC